MRLFLLSLKHNKLEKTHLHLQEVKLTEIKVYAAHIYLNDPPFLELSEVSHSLYITSYKYWARQCIMHMKPCHRIHKNLFDEVNILILIDIVKL